MKSDMTHPTLTTTFQLDPSLLETKLNTPRQYFGTCRVFVLSSCIPSLYRSVNLCQTIFCGVFYCTVLYQTILQQTWHVDMARILDIDPNTTFNHNRYNCNRNTVQTTSRITGRYLTTLYRGVLYHYLITTLGDWMIQF